MMKKMARRFVLERQIKATHPCIASTQLRFHFHGDSRRVDESEKIMLAVLFTVFRI